MKIGNLTCNYRGNPLGVETPRPALGWMLLSDERGQRQSAYRILVADDEMGLARNRGNLWDTGKVRSWRSGQIPYRGKTLRSRQRCFWKVRAWDANGTPSEWSEPACWEMGLLSEADWSARWIRHNPDIAFSSVQSKAYPPPAPHLRRVFTLKKPIVSARVYVSGLGYYELFINGSKTGDEVLAPVFSKYDESVYYQVRDVSALLRKGENALGVILGTGWYDCHTADVWDFKQAPWRHAPKLLLQLHVRHKDGTETVIVSDENWRTGTGPIVFDGLRNGETYDARRELPGWAAPGFDDRAWKRAELVAAPGGVWRSQQTPPIRITQTLRPVAVKQVKDGVWVYDVGRNISGWARLKASGPAGAEVTLRYAEMLAADGDVDQDNIKVFVLSGDCQTDRYILKGGGPEEWEPRFTYHGFRYVQVTGFPGTPTLDDLEARVVHTDFETRGEFSCSNELLNEIQSCARWSTLTNYHGIPTDCPHREKNGWTGDGLLSAEQTLLNFDPMTAYAKWMQDMRDCQRRTGQLPGIVPSGGWGFNWGSGPAWDSAAILIPWYVYLYCGDLQILRDQYESMTQYLGFMESMSPDGTVQFGLGDWSPPAAQKCPAEVTSTGYFHIDAVIVAEIAKRLGKREDAKRYAALADRVRGAFWRRYGDARSGVISGDCQTSYACALYQGLAGRERTPACAEQLVRCVEEAKRHIDCGILGAKYVLHALTDLERADLAYAIAAQTDFPSWGNWIRQGATTLWEGWSRGGSLNHHMYSDISAWFYQGLAGINPDLARPGFKNIIIRPNPVGDLTWAKAWHQSLYGRIECHWERDGGTFTLSVSIPANCTADVWLPAGVVGRVVMNGKIVSCKRTSSSGRRVAKVGSGSYRFTCEMPRGEEGHG